MLTAPCGWTLSRSLHFGAASKLGRWGSQTQGGGVRYAMHIRNPYWSCSSTRLGLREDFQMMRISCPFGLAALQCSLHCSVKSIQEGSIMHDVRRQTRHLNPGKKDRTRSLKVIILLPISEFVEDTALLMALFLINTAIWEMSNTRQASWSGCETPSHYESTSNAIDAIYPKFPWRTGVG